MNDSGRINIMKMFFILNPLAGNGKCRWRWGNFERVLRHGSFNSYEVHSTDGVGDAERAAKAAVSAGFQRIIVVGGDGTVNEVVNGVIGDHVLIGILPFGTGNDLARSLAIPSSDDELVTLLSKPKEVELNVAQINDRYFVMAAGIGFDGMVANYINSHFYIKKLGAVGYFYSALRMLTTFKPFEVQVVIDGKSLQLQKT